MADRLIDSFGRVHTNLRISVTDRCNLRCSYCMPAENVVFVDRKELLTFEEIERFVRVVTRFGVHKVRLTGGEPLVRRDLHRLVRALRRIPAIRDIGLTTNGLLLADQAEDLYRAGLRRVNISLDTLDPDRFRQLTRRDGFHKVVESIHVAKQVGFEPIKINAVAMRGLTEDDVVPLAEFARELDIEVRFIEFMPLDAENAWERERVLFAQEIYEKVCREVKPLVPRPDQDPRSPAREFEFADGRGRVAFIASVSQPFCRNCNRFRLTAEGKLRNCLFAQDETDIRAILRGGGTDDDIAEAVRRSVASKWEGHQINTARFIQPPRAMYQIGG